MKCILLAAVLALGLSAPVHAQEALPYSEGAVVEVTAVDIMDGEFDNYLEYLQSKYKPIMEAQKKAGIILDYGVYQNQVGSDEDADLYLVVFYPNMAMLDGLRQKVDPIATQVGGQSVKQSNAAFAARGKMRNIMGTELLRELKLK
ncbi:MAG TPA: hypothetical protein VFR30_11145 [Lysobacter sp.]|nr:hypothetical protein [Lysobacter sp.]